MMPVEWLQKCVLVKINIVHNAQSYGVMTSKKAILSGAAISQLELVYVLPFRNEKPFINPLSIW
jgi:hypothetical protein